MVKGDIDGGTVRDGLSSRRRRRLLTLLGAGGLTALAGCGSGNSGGNDGGATNTQTRVDPNVGDSTTVSGTGTEESTEELPRVSGQSFRLVTEINPEEISLLRFGKATTTAETRYKMAHEVYDATHDPLFVGRWLIDAYWLNPGRMIYGAVDNIEFQENLTRVELNENASWSDGKQMRAFDFATTMAIMRFSGLTDTFFRPKEISNPNHAFDDIRMPDGRDGSVIEFVDPRGIMQKFPKGWVLQAMEQWVMGITSPTHVSPVDELSEAVWEQFQRIKGSESLGSDFLSTVDFIREYITEDHLQAWRDPDHVVTSGPFKLAEFRGAQEVVLERNPEYRNADLVNYDKVVFEFADSKQRQLASLQSNRLDYLSQELSPAQTDGLPNSIQQRTVPGGQGSGLGMDHGDPHLGNRKVRAAMMYALHTKNIARNLHPKATKPVSIPGGDTWASDAVASEDWIANNLIDYGTTSQKDKAKALMRDAGYEKSGGTWRKNGQSLSYELPTTSKSPRFEQTVADQLSGFGIDTQLQTYDDANYTEKYNGGNFKMWVTSDMSGFFNGTASFWWGSHNHKRTMDIWNFYPEDKQQEALEGYADSGWVAGNYPTFKDLYIQVPPIGDPDGALEDYDMAYQNGVRSRGPESYSKEFYQQSMWIANWMMPVMPLVQRFQQTFMDNKHWKWPTGGYMWPYYPVAMTTGDMLSKNWVRANPDNPEDGASVE